MTKIPFDFLTDTPQCTYPTGCLFHEENGHIINLTGKQPCGNCTIKIGREIHTPISPSPKFGKKFGENEDVA